MTFRKHPFVTIVSWSHREILKAEEDTDRSMIIVEIGFAPLGPARSVQIAFSLYSY